MFACKVLISLCVSLLLTISCFLLGAEKTSLRFRCQLIAGIIQYFLLATFMWMAVEGYNLYIRFANSFKIAKSSTKDFCKASFFAWGKGFSIPNFCFSWSIEWRFSRSKSIQKMQGKNKETLNKITNIMQTISFTQHHRIFANQTKSISEKNKKDFRALYTDFIRI